jgi:hypothetical protein
MHALRRKEWALLRRDRLMSQSLVQIYSAAGALSGAASAKATA